MKNLFVALLLITTIYGFAESNSLFPKIKNENLEEIFVQRWTWMNICDFAYANHSDGAAHNFKNATPFEPEQVPEGSVIFATAYSIDSFFEEIHPRIKNPYILVTLYHGPTMRDLKYINDPKLIAWFANCNRDAILFPKCTIIPLGILRDENIFFQRKKINLYFEQLKTKPKTNLLYMNFTVHPGRYDGRGAIHDRFASMSYVTASNPKPFRDYMEEMANHKFVLSPWGDMLDCYRHWEALLVGAIPIVKSSALDGLCQGLPILIVDDWSDVTEDFLNAKYQEIKNKKYDMRKLYMKYWVEKIEEAKRQHFASKS
ncbi:MAG: hypothetical protein HY860_06915 [Chlamydiales bacterium]|nr:hypothetical protein [Chlamydiales bacterium]